MTTLLISTGKEATCDGISVSRAATLKDARACRQGLGKCWRPALFVAPLNLKDFVTCTSVDLMLAPAYQIGNAGSQSLPACSFSIFKRTWQPLSPANQGA